MMKVNNIYNDLIAGNGKFVLVGIGYVGVPISVEIAKYIHVIGFNNSENGIEGYMNGIGSIGEVGEAIRNTSVYFTADTARLREENTGNDKNLKKC